MYDEAISCIGTDLVAYGTGNAGSEYRKNSSLVNTY